MKGSHVPRNLGFGESSQFHLLRAKDCLARLSFYYALALNDETIHLQKDRPYITFSEPLLPLHTLLTQPSQSWRLQRRMRPARRKPPSSSGFIPHWSQVLY